MQNFKYENGLYCKGDIIESSLWPFMASPESIKFQPFDVMAFCEVHNSIPEYGQRGPSLYHSLLLRSIYVCTSSKASYKTAELSFKIMEIFVTT